MVGMLSICKPAGLLQGRDLPGGWKVLQPFARAADATGGNFATPYIVEKDGRRAFLKAMDLSRALLSGDILAGLQHFTESIRFEGEMLEVCRHRGMDRVVRLIDSGQIEMDDKNSDPLARRASTVFYFIFELAEADLRAEIKLGQSSSSKLETLFNVAVAIQQLHQQEIAHQDIKPSNVVMFKQGQKLADLGRASKRGKVAPNDQWAFPGDPTYMPPEFSYGYLANEYHDRRLGSDFYGLGSLMAFLFSLQSSSPLLIDSLAAHARPNTWKGGDYKTVLPHLIDAHSRVCAYLSPYFPSDVRAELSEAYRQLTHPDPLVRGHPRSRAQHGRPLGIDRYISLFDRLKLKQKLAEATARSR